MKYIRKNLSNHVPRGGTANGMWLFLGFAAVVAALVLLNGCANTPSGVRVVASSATATTVGDINWDEYKIPVFSVYTGPKVTVWINRDYIALKRMAASGCVTNDTAAFGVYSSQEQKQTRVELEFDAEGRADGP